MPNRAQVCTWIAALGLVMPSAVAAQDRTEREVVDPIVRDGPQARAIRAEAEVTRREQVARLADPNPGVMYSREGAGIFGVDVKPAQAGKREMVIVLHATGMSDEHRVGQVDVHANARTARAAASEGAEEAASISFLKEQQWSLDFGTALVREQSVRDAIRVPARLEARPGGAADVAATIDGRLTRVLDVALGASVSRGQELARLLPPPAVPGDLPQLQRGAG